jgi:GntR family transcriptional regulator
MDWILTKGQSKIPLDSRRPSVILSYDREPHMILRINFKSGMPIYLQIVDQVKAAAASGALQPGEALPSIRPLAEELHLNRNTVAKAYSELESLGVIETLPGKGCFLKENQSPLRKEIRRKLLIEEIDRAIVMAHHLLVPGPEFLELIRERMDALEAKRRAYEEHKEE